MKPGKSMESALEGIAQAMAKLELEKIEGYKKAKKKKPKGEDENDEELIKVLEATKED